jgi:CheY-like chemotaxis protein
MLDADTFPGAKPMRTQTRSAEPPALSNSGGIVLAPLDFPPLRVLIVDDNKDASDSLGTLLGMVGFATRVHHSGKAALAELEQFEPEACILDISMPEMDGCELAKALRSLLEGNDLLLVAVTALGAQDALQRTTDAGFDRHLVKPANPQDILDILFEFERRIRLASLYS